MAQPAQPSSLLSSSRRLQTHSWQVNLTPRFGIGVGWWWGVLLLLGFFLVVVVHIFSCLFFLSKLQGVGRGIDAGNVAKSSLNCKVEALALNPRWSREGQGGLNLCPTPFFLTSPSPDDGELWGNWG